MESLSNYGRLHYLNAHVEQKNYTHVRQWFGYERHDNQAVVPLINALCRCPGAVAQLVPAQPQVESKRREGSKTKRVYGPAQNPLERVLDDPEDHVQEREACDKCRKCRFESHNTISTAFLAAERKI